MQLWLQNLIEREVAWSRTWSRHGRRHYIRRPFSVISRLGDGVFWYSLMAALPLVYGISGLITSIHMLLTGAVALGLYKTIKSLTRRERPCHQHAADIDALVPPLDHYSFPSGHTLHAVSFSAVAIYYFPGLAWLLVPFATLVAVSRVVLGLHYPSDVAVATLLGLGLGATSISLFIW